MSLGKNEAIWLWIQPHFYSIVAQVFGDYSRNQHYKNNPKTKNKVFNHYGEILWKLHNAHDNESYTMLMVIITSVFYCSETFLRNYNIMLFCHGVCLSRDYCEIVSKSPNI